MKGLRLDDWVLWVLQLDTRSYGQDETEVVMPSAWVWLESGSQSCS